MKTKTNLNKLLTAIVLCMLLLVALPGIAAAQEDETLDIYGNANEDDTIDMRDFTYTARMILWLEDETTLADANYDGDVNVLDMTQIGLIILGRESKLTLVDAADRIVTVNKPVERVVVDMPAAVEAIKALGAADKVVGRCLHINEILFPEIIELPVTSTMGYDIDYEAVFELDPDIFLSWNAPFPGLDDVINTLEPEITVVALNFYGPETIVENTRKLRYVLNTEEKGEELIAFYEGVINDIAEKTAGLSEEEKTQVFHWAFYYDYTEQYMAYAGDIPGLQAQMEIVGGINIAEDLTGGFPYVSEEWLLKQDIDVIVCYVSPMIIPGIFGYDIDDMAVAQETREWVMDPDENPALAESDAVKDGRVYLHLVGIEGSPKFVVALAYMAKWLHPELFGDDFDPKEIHQEYLDFMGVDYDLDEHGVLFYPEEPVVK